LWGGGEKEKKKLGNSKGRKIEKGESSRGGIGNL